MQNKKFWLLAASLFLVVGCANNKPNNKVAKPVLEVNADETGLTWEAVPGATGYEIVVNDGEAQSVAEPGYAFNVEAGEYNVKVQTVKGSAKSDAAVFEYTTEAASVGELALADGRITWASYAGKSLLYKGGSVTEFTVAPADGVQVSAAGMYEFKATKGFRSDNNHFYADDSAVQTFFVPEQSASDLVVESGSASSDADLAESYHAILVDKNGNNNWTESATATITLNNLVNEEITDGNCVAMKFSYQGYYFRYEKDIAIEGAYKGFTFTVKADEDIDLTISFVVNQHMVISTPYGDKDLYGARLIYAVAEAPTSWTRYTLNFEEAEWSAAIEGLGTFTFAQAKTALQALGYSLNSMADLLSLCGSVQFRFRGHNPGPSGHNYAACRAYMDDVKLLKDAPAASSTETLVRPLVMKDAYAFISDAFTGELYYGQNSYIELNNHDGTNPDIAGSLTVTVNPPVADHVTISSNIQGYSFEAVFVSDDGGKTLVLESASGSQAALVTNAKAYAIQMLDDFESYDSAGTGYYESNKNAANCSGLRANYFGDWNTSSSDYSASILQSSWKLAGGSGDQVNLVTGQTSVCTGGKAMKIKVNGGSWMRYTTTRVMPVFNTNPEAYPKAKAFTFMAKGLSAAQTAKLRVFYQNQISAIAGNIDSGALVPQPKDGNGFFEIKTASNGWVRYTFVLDEAKSFYGWSLALQNSTTNGGSYIFIDNVAVVLA